MAILFLRQKNRGKTNEYDEKIFSEYLNFTYNHGPLRCQSQDSKILAVAEKNLESGLKSDLQNGYLNYYKILKAEIYTPKAEDSDDPDLVEQCKTANTHIVYELRLGDNTGETGLVQMERYSRVEKDESGNLVEIPEDTVYFDYDLHRLTRAHSPLSCAMDK